MYAIFRLVSSLTIRFRGPFLGSSLGASVGGCAGEADGLASACGSSTVGHAGGDFVIDMDGGKGVHRLEERDGTECNVWPLTTIGSGHRIWFDVGEPLLHEENVRAAVRPVQRPFNGRSGTKAVSGATPEDRGRFERAMSNEEVGFG